MTDQEKIINNLGIAAKKAANELSLISEDEKNKALNNLKKKIKLISSELIEINKKDIENAYTLKLSSSILLLNLKKEL